MTTIRSNSSPEENRVVFDNLILLRNELRSTDTNKRDLDSIISDCTDFDSIIDENLSPRKKSGLSQQLFPDDSTCSYSGKLSTRIPFLPIDMNAMQEHLPDSKLDNVSKTSGTTGRQRRQQQRTLRLKEQKQKKKDEGR